MPMTLYSPSLTSKPRKAVNALYRSPRDWGNSICLRKSMWLPRPQLTIAQQCCGCIVVVTGNSEDVHLALAVSRFQIDDVLRMVDPFGRTFFDLQGVRKQTNRQTEGQDK